MIPNRCRRSQPQLIMADNNKTPKGQHRPLKAAALGDKMTSYTSTSGGLSQKFGFAAFGVVLVFALCLSVSTATSAKEDDAPAARRPISDPLPNWTISASIAVASEWVGRGISMTSESPAVQANFEITNGWFYAGVYGSNLEYGATDTNNDGVADSDGGNFESDWYAGVRNKFAGIDFDIGYFLYTYNNAVDFGGDVDMWEIRGIVSTQTAMGLKPSFTAYYTPEYSYRTGRNIVLEAKAEQTLPEVGPFTPIASVLLGYNDNETGRVRPDFWFWNAGLTLGFAERYAFDLRYWETDASDCGKRTVFQCDERIIARMTAFIGEPSAGEAAAPAVFSIDGLALSSNVALTSDYVDRGLSQTDANPAVQGGFELTYRWLYAGLWASNLDFGGADPNGDGIADSAVAPIEIDWYGGARIKAGETEFDFGVVYTSYPDAFLGMTAVEFNYWELAASASRPLVAGFEAGVSITYSWDYRGETGETWAYEATLERTLTQIGPFSPTIGGLVAFNDGESNQGGSDYWYWNSGLELAFRERFAVDLRYWDTDLGGCDSAKLFQCDERVVATLSAEF